jgi:hemerythrin-like domain-containing protein
VRHGITDEHRWLGTLFEEARDAFKSGNGAIAAFARLREALEAHFDQEDTLYFPAIRALRPAHKRDLDGFMAAHERFRDFFRQLGERLEAGSLDEAKRSFEDFSEAYAQHEAGEELMLQTLEREFSTPRQAGE